ncbi:MAG TPA: helix-turn-helix domain-containing protein, partial [Gammaproteobacteria bacterium]
LLARHFAARTAARYRVAEPGLSAAGESAILAYPWPGNVRELKHMIERAVLLSGGADLTPELLALSPPRAVDAGGLAPNVTLEDAELTLIRRALKETDGNVSRAARRLGITRMALRYRIKKHGL